VSGSETGRWIALGAVELKVVHARTASGIQYMNFYIKHLGRAGHAVGGLLGEDDHEIESTPQAACVKHMTLEKVHSSRHSSVSEASIALGIPA